MEEVIKAIRKSKRENNKGWQYRKGEEVKR